MTDTAAESDRLWSSAVEGTSKIDDHSGTRRLFVPLDRHDFDVDVVPFFHSSTGEQPAWWHLHYSLLRIAAEIGTTGGTVHAELFRDVARAWTKSTPTPAIDTMSIERLHTISASSWGWRTIVEDAEFDRSFATSPPSRDENDDQGSHPSALMAFIGSSQSGDPDWASTPTSELRKQADGQPG